MLNVHIFPELHGGWTQATAVRILPAATLRQKACWADTEVSFLFVGGTKDHVYFQRMLIILFNS